MSRNFQYAAWPVLAALPTVLFAQIDTAELLTKAATSTQFSGPLSFLKKWMPKQGFDRLVK